MKLLFSSFSPTLPRNPRRRAGFSLVELLITVVLGSILIGAGWKIMQAAGGQNTQLRSMSELAGAAMEVDATVSADIQEAGRGLFSMPNIGPINVQLSTSTTDTLDALVILKPPMLDNQEAPDTTIWRVSSESCPSGSPANCFLLVGDATATFTPGQLVMVGSPTLGGNVVSVTSATAVTQSCLLDCNADFEQEAGTYLTNPPDWTADAQWAGSPCTTAGCRDIKTPPAGASCTTTNVNQTIASATTDSTTIAQYVYQPSTTTCDPGLLKASNKTSGALGPASLTPASRVFTQVVFLMQTENLGYPQIPTAIIRSGANNTPITYAQRIDVVRYYIDNDASSYRTPTLVRQSGWQLGGTFSINAPVIPNIKWLAVETRLTPTVTATSDAADDPNYRRQVMATPTTLSMTYANTNWHREDVASDSTKLNGWRFLNSYASLTGVRIRYRTVTYYRLAGESRPDSTIRAYSTVVATPNVAGGGAVVTP